MSRTKKKTNRKIKKLGISIGSAVAQRHESGQIVGEVAPSYIGHDRPKRAQGCQKKIPVSMKVIFVMFERKKASRHVYQQSWSSDQPAAVLLLISEEDVGPRIPVAGVIPSILHDVHAAARVVVAVPLFVVLVACVARRVDAP